MSQCVPNWDVEEGVRSSIEVRGDPCASSPYVAMSEYEMAELTWENGQLSMHGLGLRRGKHVQNPIKYAGTLESIVNLATQKELPAPLHLSLLETETDDQIDLVPSASASASASTVPPPPTTLPMDALVPTAGISTCVVDSCSGAATCHRQPPRAVEDGDDRSVLNKPRFVPRVPVAKHPSLLSVSTSGTFAGDCWHVPSGVHTCDRELSVAGGFTSTTSFCSQGNTFSTSARTCTDNTTTVDDHDSVCHTRPPKQTGKEEERKRGNAKSSSSNRRTRAAAIHNQSERKRRDKINQKMKTLQKMVPNANKTDKASMLDEVIDYLKQLQAQVNMMSRMSIPSMMMPQLAMQQQQQLQMSMMAAAAAPMGMGLGMGMGMGMAAIPGSIGMDINMNIHPMARQNLQAFLNPNPPFMPFSAAWPAGDVNINAAAAHNRLPSQTATSVIPTDPISTYLACQTQPVTVDAYSRMIAMVQQQQQLSSTSKH